MYTTTAEPVDREKAISTESCCSVDALYPMPRSHLAGHTRHSERFPECCVCTRSRLLSACQTTASCGCLLVWLGMQVRPPYREGTWHLRALR